MITHDWRIGHPRARRDVVLTRSGERPATVLSAPVLYAPTMRHAVLGAGGVGGLLAAVLGRAGGDVLLLMRPESLLRYPGQLTVRSKVLGDFSQQIAAAAALDRPVDVVWITVKATEMSAALALATRNKSATRQ